MSEVERWSALRDLPRARLEANPDARVAPDVGYERLTGVDRVSTGGRHHFFAGDELAVVYLPRAAVGGTDAAPLFEELGPGEELRSRTGKRSLMHVWPDRGLAVSVDEDGAVELAEVFPPTTLDGYRERIYDEPPAHVR
jgi:hypothetical protein